MTDVENLEKIIFSVFSIPKTIRNRQNTNACISPLNVDSPNLFARNFVSRLKRLNQKFGDDRSVINDIAERVKNIGEARNSGWAGPYSELVALDFYSQFSEFFALSYINQLSVKTHKKSIPAINGQKEVIDIDLCLHLRHDIVFTDVKSFNCIHQNILDEVIEIVEEYSLATLGKSVMIAVDNLSSIDYTEVKSHLGLEKRKIYYELTNAVSENRRVLHYESKTGIVFTFRIEYSDTISTVKEYSPFAMAEAYKYKFLDYGSKLLDNEYSVITMVRNPWFNEETVDFGDFNNIFYRSLARRTFIELDKIRAKAALYSSSYANGKIKVCDVAKNLAGIIFIDDESPSQTEEEKLYKAYFYMNPNYKNKKPLTIRKLEKYFRNERESQIKDFDDFKWDNY
ncbi:hypothetical protein [uncultured Treponema sp.]|uniref:hypothetical protein n=1 Tax=uncultured Treponema sp. TaxID=162155 RepID=UPI0025D29584|nr:hypothetical protein [uncultured Treponema sp.]